MAARVKALQDLSTDHDYGTNELLSREQQDLSLKLQDARFRFR